MPKIMIFGDSYAADYDNAKSWTLWVAEEFPKYKFINFAVPASSLDYLYYTYENQRAHLEANDIVLMSLTAMERIFLRDPTIYNQPRFMTAHQITPAKNGKPQTGAEFKPQEFFLGDMYNPDAHSATMNVFLNALQYDAITKNVTIIVLPIGGDDYINRKDKEHIEIATCGENQGSSNAGLSGVTKRQMEAMFDLKGRYWYEIKECWDQDSKHANHLTPRNNKILGNKVIRNIRTKEPIDLRTEWVYK